MKFDVKKFFKKAGKKALSVAPYVLAGAATVAAITPTPLDDIAVKVLHSVVGASDNNSMHINEYEREKEYSCFE